MFFLLEWFVKYRRMSLKLACEAVSVVSMVLFATAFAVTWKDCGELTVSLKVPPTVSAHYSELNIRYSG